MDMPITPKHQLTPVQVYIDRSVQRYTSVGDPCEALRMRIKELTAARVTWGYRQPPRALAAGSVEKT